MRREGVHTLSSFDWIVKKVEELDDVSAKNELAFILQKFSEIGQQGFSEKDLIKEIKSLYLKLGLNRY